MNHERSVSSSMNNKLMSVVKEQAWFCMNSHNHVFTSLERMYQSKYCAFCFKIYNLFFFVSILWSYWSDSNFFQVFNLLIYADCCSISVLMSREKSFIILTKQDDCPVRIQTIHLNCPKYYSQCELQLIFRQLVLPAKACHQFLLASSMWDQ